MKTKQNHLLCPMEPRELDPTQQPMEHVAHLMEERHHIVVPHQRRLFGRRLGEVGHHCGDGVVAPCGRAARVGADGRELGVYRGELVSGDERPHGGVAVFILCGVRGWGRRGEQGGRWITKEHTTRKQIKVGVSYEASFVLRAFLPYRELLHL
jgi:hypothetical protein